MIKISLKKIYILSLWIRFLDKLQYMDFSMNLQDLNTLTTVLDIQLTDAQDKVFSN